MPTDFSDDFNRAAQNSLGSNYTKGPTFGGVEPSPGLLLTGSQAAVPNWGTSYYTAQAYDGNQWVQAKVGQRGDYWEEVRVRGQVNSITAYGFGRDQIDNGGSNRARFWKTNGGTRTSLWASSTTDVNSGDVIYMAASESNFELWVNSTNLTTVTGETTYSRAAGGYTGMSGRNSTINNPQFDWFAAGEVPTGGGGAVVNTVYISDGMFFMDPQSKEEEHQQLDLSMMFLDVNPLGIEKYISLQILLNDLQTKDLSKTVQTGLYLNDTTTSERFLNLIEYLFLYDTGIAVKGFEVAVADGLYLPDSRYSDLAARLNDNLLMLDGRAFELLLYRLLGLFINDISGPPTYIPWSNNDILIQDGLLMDDGRISDRSLSIMVQMLLNDGPVVERLMGMIDTMGLVDYRYNATELNATDLMFLNDRIMQLRELLWTEGLNLLDSVDRQVTGVLVAFLVYGRIAANSMLAMFPRAVEYLSMAPAVTKWRIDL